MIYLIQHYLAETALRFPDKTAVSCRDESVSYRELDLSTNALARALVRLGADRGAFIPIFMAKSVNAISAILAVLKSDCAYVPVDTGSPAERLSKLLEATRAPFVLVDNESEAAFDELMQPAQRGIRVVNIDNPVFESREPLVCRNISIDVAYVLFTSGSTGMPKGVMISHQMVIDYIDWCVETYALTERDVIANHAPLYFDNSTFDLYTAFKSGAELHLVYDELNVLMHKLVGWLESRKITTFFCVPSVLTILLRSRRVVPGCFPDLRHVIAAGEVLPPEVLRGWMSALPHVQYANMYGPTEITVDCTFHVVTDLPLADESSIPIGRPRPNMEVFLRAEDGSLSIEPGSDGEIAVRGKSVSYGYLNNAEKTRAAFIQNPHHDLYHDPVYLTGDLARIDAHGRFLYVGRKDRQIKFMGNRIELGEVEVALMRVEGVTEGVVVFNDAPSIADKCIAALVVLEEGVTTLEVAKRLREALPAYMVPRQIVASEKMPRTPNGKSDRLSAFDMIFPAKS